jgi:acyl transferase domain-containing protein
VTAGPDRDPVAVVGLGCVYPGAADAAAFWRNVVAGTDAVGPMPAERFVPELFAFETDRGGFVDGDGLWFDAGRFGVMPRVVRDTDPDQFLALATAAAALDDSGAGSEVDCERVGVILGRGGYLTPGGAQFVQRVRTAGQLHSVLRTLLPEVAADRLDAVRDAFVDQLGPLPNDAAVGVLPNMAASRIANRLDLGGPAYVVDAACASSLVAVDAGIAELASGRCDLVLAGGVHHCDDLVLWAGFSKLGALSPTGSIRPFSRHADGILIGEGTGMVALERLSAAERHGHRVYAVLRGTGVSSDGRDASLVSPNVDGQVLALERAYRAAAVDPATVELVEGHGTATPTGDRAELETIRRVFGKAGDDAPPGVLGSVKSMIGHAMPAAGAAGLIKAVLAVHHGVHPPTLHADDPHPALADTRFRLLDAAEEWVAAGGGPRRAGVNAFGFGGINGHVIVEEYPAGRAHAAPTPAARAGGAGAGSGPGGARSTPRASGTAPASAAGAGDGAFRFEALLLAGDDADDLAAQLAAHAGGSPTTAPVPPAEAGPARLAIVDPNPKRVELAARALGKHKAWRGLNDVWVAPEGLVTAGGRVAFLFPGVEPDVGADFTPVARWFGRPLRPLPEGWTDVEAQGHQILVAGRLLSDVLGDLGVRPDDIAGHSVGEWTGWYPAELIPADGAEGWLDGLRPGAFDVPDVAYLALGCGAGVAADVIADLDGVAVSHDNCVHQSVVCGPAAAIAVARGRFAERKVVAQEMPFRSGFHSPAFVPYVDRLRPLWDRMPLQPATTPLWSATSCERYPDDPDAVRELAVAHLVEPVRFRQLTERLYDDGVRAFVQPGVGSLASFVDDTLGKRPHLAVAAYSPKRPALDQLARVAAALWVEGVDVDFAPLARAGAVGTAAAVGAPSAPPARPPGHRVRLTLGTPLVRLPASTRLDGAAGARRPAAAAVAPAAGSPGVLASAHDALLAEALAASRDVSAAFARVATAAPDDSEGKRPPERTLAARTPAAPRAPRTATTDVRVDLETFPWLRDHCIIQQSRDWHDLSDGFPVVPATGLVHMMGEAATRLVPGTVVTAIEDVRAARFVTAAPPTDVRIRATEGAEAGVVRVAVEDPATPNRPFARATVRVAATPPPAPAPRARPLTNRFPSPRSARQLYDEGWMFHGPRYHGVREVVALGDEGVDGVIEALPTPGATLDCAAQVYGWWVLVTEEVNSYCLPQSIDRIELYAPLPAGERFTNRVRITDVQPRTVTADLELTDAAGTVVARILGSTVRRFNSDGHLWGVSRFPATHPLSTRLASGVTVVDERWRDSASRELMSYVYLNATERAAYRGLVPLAQRHWLLERIAAKDAVRFALWDAGAPAIYPAEITLADDEDGRPYVAEAPHGGTGLDLAVSSTTWVGAALAQPRAERGPGGIGVEMVAVEPALLDRAAAALAPDELALLPGHGRGPAGADGAGGPEAGRWLARAGAAREAARQATGHAAREAATRAGDAAAPAGPAGPGPGDGHLALRAVDVAGARLLVGDLWVATADLEAPVQARPGEPTGTFDPDPVPPAVSPDEKEFVLAWTHRDA